MPNYRRPASPGGTFFFTLVTQGRRPILCSDLARPILRAAITQTRLERPFILLAIILFGDHLHLMLELPPGDSGFSSRLAAIKARFTRGFLKAGGGEISVTADRSSHGGRGVWQPRFFDHLIRDDDDYARHLDYIHYNAVKHRRAACPHGYPYSSFQKWVGRNVYEPDWGCSCSGVIVPPDFKWTEGRNVE